MLMCWWLLVVWFGGVLLGICLRGGFVCGYGLWLTVMGFGLGMLWVWWLLRGGLWLLCGFVAFVVC